MWSYANVTTAQKLTADACGVGVRQSSVSVRCGSFASVRVPHHHEIAFVLDPNSLVPLL